MAAEDSMQFNAGAMCMVTMAHGPGRGRGTWKPWPQEKTKDMTGPRCQHMAGKPLKNFITGLRENERSNRQTLPGGCSPALDGSCRRVSAEILGPISQTAGLNFLLASPISISPYIFSLFPTVNFFDFFARVTKSRVCSPLFPLPQKL